MLRTVLERLENFGNRKILLISQSDFLYPVCDYMISMAEISNDEIRYKILELLYRVAKRGYDWRVKRSYLKDHLDVDERLIDFNVRYLDDRKLAKIVSRTTGNW